MNDSIAFPYLLLELIYYLVRISPCGYHETRISSVGLYDWFPLSRSQNPAHGDVITDRFLHNDLELWTKAWNNLREKAVLVAESEEGVNT